MGETIKNTSTFKLPNKTVKVKYIKKRQGMAQGVSDDHVISGGFLEGAHRSFPVAMTRSGALKNVFTTEELDFFQNLMPGENFSIYGKFWDTKRVKLTKKDTILDLNNPEDYIKYKILLGWNQIIAPSFKLYKNAPSPAYQFYIEDEEEVKHIESNIVETKQKAYRLFAKVDEDKDTLAAILFLLSGKKASATKIGYLRTQVGKILDAKPEKFINLLEDPHFETKCLVASAERLGVIKKSNNSYITAEGQPITKQGQTGSVKNVVAFLNDPLNNEVRELIVSRVENASE